MKALIEYISTSLVDDPTQVDVSQFRRGSKTVLKLQVAKEDMGRVIGKKGRVANAMRTLLRVVSARQETPATLEIVS